MALTPLLPTFTIGEPVTTRKLNTTGAHLQHLFAQHNGGVRATKPLLVVTRDIVATSAVPTGEARNVVWNIVESDTDTPSMTDPAARSILTVRTPGLWLVDLTLTGTAAGSPAAGAYLLARLFRNGTDPMNEAIASVPARWRSGTDGAVARCSVPALLDRGDTIFAVVQNESGGDANLSATPGANRLSMEWLAPLSPIVP